MNKDKLNKRYKALRWAQHILYWLGNAACVIPMLIASVKIVPGIKTTESRLAFGGVAIFFTAIVVLVLAKSIIAQVANKIPPALIVFITVVALLIFMICLQKVIDEAVAILAVGAIGSFIGVLSGTASTFCKCSADDIEVYYKKGKYGDV